MSDEQMVTSLAFETDDEEVNAGSWVVTIQSGDGSIVTTGPWEHTEALEFAEALTGLRGIPGQAVVEPLFERPDLDTAREFLTDNAGSATGEHDTAPDAAPEEQGSR